MFEFIDTLYELIPGYMLIMTRISALIMTFPIFSYPMITVKIRILLVIVLTFIIFPIVGSNMYVIDSLPLMVLAISREVLIGSLIGFGTQVLFEAINMAGSFVGRQMGLAIANVMDPSSRQQIPIVSRFWMLVMVTFFITMDGHHLFIETLFINFSLIPIGGGEFTPESGQTLIQVTSRAFEIALRLGAPAMIFLLLVDTAIGFTARVMPQMNIFFVTLPLKLGLGIFVLISSLNIFQMIFDTIYDDLTYQIWSMITYLSGT